MMEQMGTMEKKEAVSVEESLQITATDALEGYKKVYLKAMEQGVLMETQIEKLVANSRLMADKIAELEEENKDYKNLVDSMQEELDEFKKPPQQYDDTTEQNIED